MSYHLLPALAVVLFLVICTSAQTKLLRFPDIHGDRVVAELMKKIVTPVKLPPRPADPNKNRP